MSLCTGKVTFLNSNYEWKIHRFGTHHVHNFVRGSYLSSPIFTTLCYDKNSANVARKLQWHLRVYLAGSSPNLNQKHISLYLVKSADSDVTTEFSLTIVAASGNHISSSVSELHIFEEGEKMWGWNNFIEVGALFTKAKECLQNDVLTISCCIYKKKVQCFEDRKMLDYFGELLNSGEFSDVTLTIGDKSIQAHKNVLAAGSPKFRRIFKSQGQNVVNVVGIKKNVMYELLRYLYTRKVQEIGYIVTDLFVAAHTYQVNGLKDLCEKTICNGMNASNALVFLEMAVRYEMKILKPMLLKIIVKDLKEFTKKREFNSLSSECKSELLGYISNKKIRNS